MKKTVTMLFVFVSIIIVFQSFSYAESVVHELRSIECEEERDLPEGEYEEMGDGIVYISTPGGTSEDDNVPVMYIESNTLIKQIGINAWNFNGSSLSFVYIDGMLFDKTQMSNTQSTLTLTSDQLTEGFHNIEVVQYVDDCTENDMITYRNMKYEIRYKK